MPNPVILVKQKGKLHGQYQTLTCIDSKCLTLNKQETEEKIMAAIKSISICVRFGSCIVIALFMGFVIVTGVVSATAQQAAPTESNGITITPLSAVDLGPEIPGMQGRQLRLRMLTIEPGGVLSGS